MPRPFSSSPRLLVGGLALAALAACASAPAAAPAAAPPAGGPLASSALFDFYSRPGVNLHHFLYEWARAEAPKDRRLPIEVVERARFDGLAPDDARAWRAALDLYRRDWIARTHFEPEILAVRRVLIDADGPGDPALAALPAELAAALRAAWPVYERAFWLDHDRANRAWVAAVLPLLERHERQLSAAMARAVGGTWPGGRLPVDVSAYASWSGAYTTNSPDHVVVSSTHPSYQGHSSLEMLIHESGHAASLEGPLREAITAAFAPRDAREPDNLWHGVIFWSAGELTRRALVAEAPGYVPFAAREGLWERGPGWSAARRVLDRHWPAVVDGTTTPAAALAEIAAELDPATDP